VVADRHYLLVIKPFSFFFAFLSLFLARFFFQSAEAVCAVSDRPGTLGERFRAPLFLTNQDPQGKVRDPPKFCKRCKRKVRGAAPDFFATGQGNPDFFGKSKFGMYTPAHQAAYYDNVLDEEIWSCEYYTLLFYPGHHPNQPVSPENSFFSVSLAKH
jgi:hypothetical protein